MPKVSAVVLLIALVALSCGDGATSSSPPPSAPEPEAIASVSVDSAPVTSEAIASVSVESAPVTSEGVVPRGEVNVSAEGRRLHNVLANASLGEIVLLWLRDPVTGTHDTLYVTQDGQVVLVAGVNRSELGSTEYNTWEVGKDGFQQVRDAVRDMGAVGNGSIPATAQGGISIIGNVTRIVFEQIEASEDQPSAEVQTMTDAFLSLFENAQNPEWYTSGATQREPWIPYRVAFEHQNDTARDVETTPWPFEESVAELALIDTSRETYLCLEGQKARVAWESIVVGRDAWNRIAVEHEGQVSHIRAVPYFPSTSKSEFPDTCSGVDPQKEMLDDPTLLVASARRNVGRFSREGRQLAIDSKCPELSGRVVLVPEATIDDDAPAIGCFVEHFDWNENQTEPVVGFTVGIADGLLHEFDETMTTIEVLAEQIDGAPVEVRRACLAANADLPWLPCGGFWISNGFYISVIGGDPEGVAQLEFLRSNFAKILQFAAEAEVLYE